MAKFMEMVFGGDRLEKTAAKINELRNESKADRLEQVDEALAEVERKREALQKSVEGMDEKVQASAGQTLVQLVMQEDNLKTQRKTIEEQEQYDANDLKELVIDMIAYPTVEVTPIGGRATKEMVSIVHIADAIDEFKEGGGYSFRLKKADFKVLKDNFNNFEPKEVRDGVFPAWQNMNPVRRRIFAVAADILEEASEVKED